ncbi:MAG TPA: hypothetical protein P5081_18380, partial [Phycisphaerae bacterium]|nr:hypothetical protein [Phycisphaerae bacterium]
MSANRKSLRNRHLRAVCHFVAASCLAVLSGVTACQSIDSLPLGLLLYPHEFEVYDATNDGAVRVGSVDFQLQDAKRAHAETSPNVSASVAARWTPLGGVQMLGFLDDGASGRLQVFSRALAVSDDGSVVIGVSQSKTANSEAFRWTQESGMQTLAALPMGVSNVWPLGISADAQYVVGRATINDTFKGFFWSQASGYVLIDPNDDSITRVEVVGVSDD